MTKGDSTPDGRDLPSGTVTFLFTDIEGSTKLLHELGADAYADALAEHRHLVREAFTRHGGVEVDTHATAVRLAAAAYEQHRAEGRTRGHPGHGSRTVSSARRGHDSHRIS